MALPTEPPEIGTGVLLKGLPFTISTDEIKAFFKSLIIPTENIHIMNYDDGKGTGLAFVKLKDKDEMSHAMLMDKNHIGSRYVEVSLSDESEMWQLMLDVRHKVIPSELYKKASRLSDHRRKGWTEMEGDNGPIRNKLTTRFCYVVGIPAGCNYKGVRRFFGGCLIARNCVYLLRGQDGVFRGDAYIEFANEDECLKGLMMDGKDLMGSQISVLPCSEREVNEMGGRSQYDERQDYHREDYDSRKRGRGGRERTPPTIKRRKEAYVEKYGGHEGGYGDYLQDDTSFDSHNGSKHSFSGSQYSRSVSERSGYSSRHGDPYYSTSSGPQHQHQQQQDPYGSYRRIQHTETGLHTTGSRGREGYGSSGAYSQAMSRHGSNMGRERDEDRSRGRGYATSRPESGYDTGASSSHSRGGSGYLEDYSAQTLSSRSAPEELPIRDQRVVRMEGLPYDISVPHLLQFFQGYNLSYESVRIQCRDDGSPSGKAFVTFPSEKLARRAAYDLNKRYVGGRYVELFLV